MLFILPYHFLSKDIMHSDMGYTYPITRKHAFPVVCRFLSVFVEFLSANLSIEYNYRFIPKL